jgi:hypothetical protein
MQQVQEEGAQAHRVTRGGEVKKKRKHGVTVVQSTKRLNAALLKFYGVNPWQQRVRGIEVAYYAETSDGTWKIVFRKCKKCCTAKRKVKKKTK